MRWVAVGSALVGSVALACIGELVSSVHFNTAGADLALPPSAIVLNVWDEHLTRDASEPSYRYVEGEYEAQEVRRKRIDEALAAAQAKAVASPTPETLRAAAVAARAKVEFAQATQGDGLDSARDRAEVFEVVAKAPSATLGTYLEARARLDGGKPADAAALLAKAPATGAGDPLAPQWRYLDGILLYDRGRLSEAAACFEEAARAKSSPRRAPALIMAARSLLRGPKPSARDLARAESALDALDAEFGGGRFAWSSRGWRGRLALLRGQRGAALAAYLKQSDTARTTPERINALASTRLVLAGLDAAGSAAFRAEVKRDPSLLRPYLDYRIHHTVLTAAGRTSLYAFVREFSSGGPVRLGGDLRAYLAEMALAAGDREGAGREASAALAAGAERSDLARYVLGGVALRAKRWPEAERQFRTVAERPGSLARAAKEPLALALERQGRLGDALDLYWDLGYDLDRAYLLDVKMTPDEVRGYLDRQPAGARADLVRYSLGMRLLRLDRYDEAEALFLDLGDRRAALAKAGSREYAWAADESKTEIDKLYDPLETARELRRLRKTLDGTKGEERAGAMYALASLYYTRRNLLLYNAALWSGGRGVMDFADTASQANDANDGRRIEAHLYEHECLWRARAACLQIVKEAPDSPWAAKALYRAATAERRLADFNPQWRGISAKRLNLWKAAAGHLETLAARFPNDPLAKNARKYAGVFREEAGDAWKALTPDERLARIRLRAGRDPGVAGLERGGVGGL